MAVKKQDDQHEHTFSNYVRIQDVVHKTCLRRWTIGKSGEKGSGISVLPARHDDDDNDEMSNSSIWAKDWTLSGATEWTWEQWQWRFTPHSQNLHHYWNLTIRLFNVIYRTFVGGGSYLIYSRSILRLRVEWAMYKEFNNECYIIAEGFFYYHFSLVISYLSLVSLRTIRLSARVGAHIERRCSRSRREDVTITYVIIKNPDRKWLGMWMTSCPEVKGWGFWVIFEKKQLVEIWT